MKELFGTQEIITRESRVPVFDECSRQEGVSHCFLTLVAGHKPACTSCICSRVKCSMQKTKKGGCYCFISFG